MKKLCLTSLGCFWLSSIAWAGSTTTKTEIVEEQDKSEVKVFCSKVSEKDAVATCQKWLDTQTKTLGQRLLLSHCSDGEMVSNNPSCLFRATGELKYVLKKYKTETERNN